MADIVVIDAERLSELVEDAVRRAMNTVQAQEVPLVRSVMTEREAAEYMRFAPNTLRQWRVEGIGPRYVKSHGAIRYRRSDIDEWLSRNGKLTRDASIFQKKSG